MTVITRLTTPRGGSMTLLVGVRGEVEVRVVLVGVVLGVFLVVGVVILLANEEPPPPIATVPLLPPYTLAAYASPSPRYYICVTAWSPCLSSPPVPTLSSQPALKNIYPLISAGPSPCG